MFLFEPNRNENFFRCVGEVGVLVDEMSSKEAEFRPCFPCRSNSSIDRLASSCVIWMAWSSVFRSLDEIGFTVANFFLCRDISRNSFLTLDSWSANALLWWCSCSRAPKTSSMRLGPNSNVFYLQMKGIVKLQVSVELVWFFFKYDNSPQTADCQGDSGILSSVQDWRDQ